MIIGEYQSPLGEKNRVALPKVMRDELTGEIIISRGYEGCLMILDKSRWDLLLNNVNQSPLLNINTRDTKRFLLGGAFKISWDKQGRFVIPAQLVEFANLKEEITFVGVGDWLEVWSSETWETRLAEVAKHSAQIAERLSI